MCDFGTAFSYFWGYISSHHVASVIFNLTEWCMSLKNNFVLTIAKIRCRIIFGSRDASARSICLAKRKHKVVWTNVWKYVSNLTQFWKLWHFYPDILRDVLASMCWKRIYVYAEHKLVRELDVDQHCARKISKHNSDIVPTFNFHGKYTANPIGNEINKTPDILCDIIRILCH